ncbi:MAG: type II toxin-antitoxin system VapC family toxin [Lentisphaeria bacterium]|nr:type II toxin-antitoxin system VapC family toxin [Lentisphaeria bacterium]
MESVVDASVLVAVLMNEPEKPRIIELTSDADLVAPGCVPWEIGNALSAMLKRGRLSVDVARLMFAAFEGIPIRYVPVEFGNALQLSGDHQIYAYDAYYLDCAHRHRVPLLTLDKRLRQIAAKLGIATPEI